MLAKEVELTQNMINRYLQLNSVDDATNEIGKFHDLERVTEKFMTHIQKEELNYSKNINLQFEPQKRQEKQLTSKIYNGMFILKLSLSEKLLIWNFHNFLLSLLNEKIKFEILI